MGCAAVIDNHIAGITVISSQKTLSDLAISGRIAFFQLWKNSLTQSQVIGVEAHHSEISCIGIGSIMFEAKSGFRLDQSCKIDDWALRIITDDAYF